MSKDPDFQACKYAVILGLAGLVLGTLHPYYLDALPFFQVHPDLSLPLAISAPVVGATIGGAIDRRRQSDGS